MGDGATAFFLDTFFLVAFLVAFLTAFLATFFDAFFVAFFAAFFLATVGPPSRETHGDNLGRWRTGLS
jgi:hypothetical protein